MLQMSILLSKHHKLKKISLKHLAFRMSPPKVEFVTSGPVGLLYGKL